MAVRVAEVDGLEDGVVGHTDDLNALGFQPRLGVFQRLDAVHLEGDVLHPVRRVRVTAHGRRIRDLEKRQDVAAAGVQEQVHVGVGRVRGRHLVFGDGEHELHVQVLDIPIYGFLGVLAAVRNVVNFVDLHGYLLACLG